ncbi:MAG: HAMP domain-containing sensor histidine kinase [Candidatus Saccharimonadales bacterium]
MGSKPSTHQTELGLIAATVHELKTPLTLIHGMSAMLESETFGELNFKQREQIRHISSASERLGFIIDSLLHVENLPHTQRLQPVQLQTELQAAIGAMAEKAAEREIVIKYRPKRLPPVLADPISIYQLLMHLVSAAIRYAPSGSAIEIKTKRRNKEAVIQLRDHGAGISSKEAKSILESFGKRRQPIRAHSDSSGLSLYIAKSIVEFYGGSLQVSSLSQGSQLTICLPISNQLSLFE